MVNSHRAFIFEIIRDGNILRGYQGYTQVIKPWIDKELLADALDEISSEDLSLSKISKILHSINKIEDLNDDFLKNISEIL